jgi:hypothetical protein
MTEISIKYKIKYQYLYFYYEMNSIQTLNKMPTSLKIKEMFL